MCRRRGPRAAEPNVRCGSVNGGLRLRLRGGVFCGGEPPPFLGAAWRISPVRGPTSGGPCKPTQAPFEPGGEPGKSICVQVLNMGGGEALLLDTLGRNINREYAEVRPSRRARHSPGRLHLAAFH